MVDPNTRQGKRTPVTLKIKFKSETLEQFIERYAVDVSQGGIFIRTKEPLAVGTQMKFEFQLRDASPLIAGEGTVVWTRENDPSRPAIAPGMGVRFDRLADGSQGILERILSEKAKQAPQRPAADTSKPPLFTDTPTRVAPAPVQDALLGNGRPGDPSLTPLPKPMPFHSDADEFPDEAFEEATKVRALDELIAQTADTPDPDEQTTRRNGRSDATMSDPADRAQTMPLDGHEAPGLPNPPEPVLRPQARMLDTTPSPRVDSLPALVSPQAAAKTHLGIGPPRAAAPSPPPPLPMTPLGASSSMVGPMSGSPVLDESMRDEGPVAAGMRSVPSESTAPARMPSARAGRSSAAPIVILILLILAAGGAAAWFFVLRPRQLAENEAAMAQGSATPEPGSGSAIATGSSGDGSAAAQPPPPPPPAPLADTVIAASVAGATIEIVGTDQKGAAPLTAKLETGKAYKAKITAPGFMTVEVDVKGGGEKVSGTLAPKPRILEIESDPTGATITVDGTNTGFTTPHNVELTPAQAAKKAVRVQIKKTGFRSYNREFDLSKLTEEPAKMVGKINEKLSQAQQQPPAQQPAQTPAQPPSTGPVTTPDGTEPGREPPPEPVPPPVQPAPAPPAGSNAEPEPDFNKQQ